MKKLETRSLTTMALLIAMMIVTSQLLSFETQFLKITFTFIPQMILGMLFGPIWAGIAGVVADFAGMALFGKAAFFFGFTLNAFLESAIYGYFFYKKEITWKNTIPAVLVATISINLILTPIWLSMMYGVPLDSWVIWAPRIIKTVIWMPIQIFTMYYLGQIMPYKRWANRLNIHPGA